MRRIRTLFGTYGEKAKEQNGRPGRDTEIEAISSFLFWFQYVICGRWWTGIAGLGSELHVLPPVLAWRNLKASISFPGAAYK